MTTAAIARLDRRVDALEETVRAISDTLVDLAEKSDEHTVTLDRHSEVLDQHTATLERHSTILDQHTATLERHTAILDQHTAMLVQLGEQMAEVLRRLPEPT